MSPNQQKPDRRILPIAGVESLLHCLRSNAFSLLCSQSGKVHAEQNHAGDDGKDEKKDSEKDDSRK